MAKKSEWYDRFVIASALIFLFTDVKLYEDEDCFSHRMKEMVSYAANTSLTDIGKGNAEWNGMQ